MLLSLALLASLTGGVGVSTPGDTLSAAAILRPASAAVSLTATLRPPALEGVRAPTMLEPGLGGLGLARTLQPVGLGLSAPRPALPGPRRTIDAPPRESAPQIIEYSDAYFTRLTIHKWASYLMLPLFVSDYVVGQKLINGQGSDRLRGVHGALGAGIAGLFAVNTVTGGLNTIEAWKDPYGRTRRTIHSALMLLADVGFVLTAAMANERESEGGQVVAVNNNNHKRMALASMGTALIGYSIMLPFFGND